MYIYIYIYKVFNDLYPFRSTDLGGHSNNKATIVNNKK